MDVNAKADLLIALREREKELNCLYMVDEILNDHRLPISEALEAVVNVIPSGWRFPDLCRAKITYKNCRYQSAGFIVSRLADKCHIESDGEIVGSLEVTYLEDVPETPEGVFLEKERKLLRTIADRRLCQ